MVKGLLWDSGYQKLPEPISSPNTKRLRWRDLLCDSKPTFSEPKSTSRDPVMDAVHGFQGHFLFWRYECDTI
jgi:hypothetical protein